MAPKLRSKGPIKGSNMVSFHSVNVKNQKNRSSTRTLNVRIRLPSSALRSLTSDDSELSSLDYELNQALKNDQVADSKKKESFKVSFRYPSPKKETQSMGSTQQQITQESPLASPAPSLQASSNQGDNKNVIHEKREVQKETSVTPSNASNEPGYRTIPSNLIMILKREFGLLNETAEELNMIEKIIFTLRDPLSTTKIRLPVKAIVCNHFECFDFDNFCLFNHLPTGIKNVLRKDLIKKSNELKKRDKLLTSKNKDLNRMDVISLTKSFIYQPNFSTLSNLSNSYPMYKCPICNKSFELNQLFISDIYNYFVKTTPMDIDRIELLDMIKYRIVDDDSRRSQNRNHKDDTEEVIILSDEEDESIPERKDESIPEKRDVPSDKTTDNLEQEFDISSLKKEFPNFDASKPDSNGDNHFKEPTPAFQSDSESEFPSGSKHYPNFSSEDSFDRAYENYWSNGLSRHNQPQQIRDNYSGSGSWEDPVTLD